jgi:hypothetical protein
VLIEINTLYARKKKQPYFIQLFNLRIKILMSKSKYSLLTFFLLRKKIHCKYRYKCYFNMENFSSTCTKYIKQDSDLIKLYIFTFFTLLLVAYYRVHSNILISHHMYIRRKKVPKLLPLVISIFLRC